MDTNRSVSTMLQKAKMIYINEGFLTLVSKTICKLNQAIFATNSGVWYRNNLNDFSHQIIPKIPVEITFDSFEETIIWLKQCPDKWMYHATEHKIALQEKHYFPNIRYKGRIVGCIKIGFNNVYVFDYLKIIKFPRKIAYIYDSYIIPEFRRLGLFTYMMSEACSFL